MLELTSSWHVVNPGYGYTLFSYDSAREFIYSNYGERELRVFDSAKFPAMMSDIFRVAYCYASGGVYVDAGTMAVKCLDSLLQKNNDLLLMRKWHGAVWNGFIVSRKGSHSLGVVWEKIIANVENRVSENIWSLTGPGVFTDTDLSDASIIDQLSLKEYFDIVNDLQHKKEAHWSNLQKGTSIYR
ncbi:hypothetical protein GCM10025791_13580 [Halioxenophilus aromaticivorans]|uniref:Uncharacterized protein n=2 Tax=Halioxenophilus aromaticivorans TaxID=1306992 RepID=A0AAV3U0R6_9ALTE